MAGHRYEMTAQIWKATMQRTYMLSRTVSHYTVTTTEAELQALHGQDAIMIANDKYELNPQEFAKFDSCEVREFKFYRADELSRIFKLYWCKNFQGILK
jgi:dolichol-phosphate mannosyltransferase